MSLPLNFFDRAPFFQNSLTLTFFSVFFFVMAYQDFTCLIVSVGESGRLNNYLEEWLLNEKHETFTLTQLRQTFIGDENIRRQRANYAYYQSFTGEDYKQLRCGANHCAVIFKRYSETPFFFGQKSDFLLSLLKSDGHAHMLEKNQLTLNYYGEGSTFVVSSFDGKPISFLGWEFEKLQVSLFHPQVFYHLFVSESEQCPWNLLYDIAAKNPENRQKWMDMNPKDALSAIRKHYSYIKDILNEVDLAKFKEEYQAIPRLVNGCGKMIMMKKVTGEWLKKRKQEETRFLIERFKKEKIKSA
jgi:hypothetical protein